VTCSSESASTRISSDVSAVGRFQGSRARVRRAPNGRGFHGKLERAKERLDCLDLYSTPVRLDGVRVLVAPWFFKLPLLRRFSGYALRRTILLRSAEVSDDLLTHELCHLWQMQQRPRAAMLAWLRYSYEENPFELECRNAVDRTRGRARNGPGLKRAAVGSGTRTGHTR
jgi:hypothetical protein